MALSKKRSAPALEQAKRLQAAADLFNRELFDGQLPPTMLRLGIRKGARGTYFPDKFRDEHGELLDCIQLNSTDATDRPLIELLSTLVHEQAHQYVCRVINKGAATGGHGPEWRDAMTERGLPPIRIGRTWRQATHEIDPDGRYAQVFAAHAAELERLPWQELAKDASRGRAAGLDKVRFQCPSCGSKAWARASAELLCGTCSSSKPARLVVMLPEVKAEGGSGRGGASRATATRTDYPEPSTTPGLPVWTDDLGRALRLHCGIDHPPQSIQEALVVLLFGVRSRDADLWAEANAAALEQTPERWEAVRKQLYRHRAQLLHPDSHPDVSEEQRRFMGEAFKVLQVACRILQTGEVHSDDFSAAAKAAE